MNKKFVKTLTIALLFSTICTGCQKKDMGMGNSSSQDEKVTDEENKSTEESTTQRESVTEPQTTIAETEPITEQVTEPATEPVTQPQVSYDLNSLDTSIQSWGPGVNFDELNRPYAAVNNQNLYGQYNADFIKDNSSNTIYLTFDEGYENGYTTQILDILKAKNVKAVFFITYPYAQGNQDLVQRMINEGHVVGNHSVNHPSAGLPSESIDQQTEEIMQLHNYVKDNFGYEMYLFRYPAGIFSEQSLALTYSLGYRSVFWSFAHADWNPDNQPDESASLSKLTDRLHPGAIYLLHAVSKTNTDILSDFIDQTQAAGYTFAEYTR